MCIRDRKKPVEEDTSYEVHSKQKRIDLVKKSDLEKQNNKDRLSELHRECREAEEEAKRIKAEVRNVLLRTPQLLIIDMASIPPEEPSKRERPETNTAVRTSQPRATKQQPQVPKKKPVEEDISYVPNKKITIKDKGHEMRGKVQSKRKRINLVKKTNLENRQTKTD